MLDELRARLIDAYRATRCEVVVDGAWVPLGAVPAERPLALVTAWNPDSRPLPEPVNLARDEVLRAELAARGLEALRARGIAPDRTWHEDSWLIPHRPETTLALLRRYGQLAALIVAGDQRTLLWRDGRVDTI